MRYFTTFASVAVLLTTTAVAHEIIHGDHGHEHKRECGHLAVAHDGHVDFLHDGHLHSPHGSHADEHAVSVSATNPADESLTAVLADAGDHNEQDKHPVVQHGDHFDHIHNGRLHRMHGDHVDDHGPISIIAG